MTHLFDRTRVHHDLVLMRRALSGPYWMGAVSAALVIAFFLAGSLCDLIADRQSLRHACVVFDAVLLVVQGSSNMVIAWWWFRSAPMQTARSAARAHWAQLEHDASSRGTTAARLWRQRSSEDSALSDLRSASWSARFAHAVRRWWVLARYGRGVSAPEAVVAMSVTGGLILTYAITFVVRPLIVSSHAPLRVGDSILGALVLLLALIATQNVSAVAGATRPTALEAVQDIDVRWAERNNRDRAKSDRAALAAVADTQTQTHASSRRRRL